MNVTYKNPFNPKAGPILSSSAPRERRCFKWLCSIGKRGDYFWLLLVFSIFWFKFLLWLTLQIYIWLSQFFFFINKISRPELQSKVNNFHVLNEHSKSTVNNKFS